MKLFSSYNHTFSNGKTFMFDIWDVIKDIPSLNGVYLCDPDYLEVSKIGVNNTTQYKVKTWFNMIEDGNYLYSMNGAEPTLVINDSQFNGYPSIEFSDNTIQQLLFKFFVIVGTIVIVYLTRQNDSYLIFAPRMIAGDGTNPDIFYDAYPRSGNQLWTTDTLSGSSIYNATSRINGREVLGTQAIPLNSPRILTVKNIDNADKVEPIMGFGGRTGLPNGTTTYTLGKSVQGKIAAILTFEEDISLPELENLEFELGKTYINYTGVSLIDHPSFKTLIGTTFSFDFSTIAVDEWFDITSYELLYPLDLGLSFSGSILSGLVSSGYEGKLGIRVSNSASMVKEFEFDFTYCRKDPIVDYLPKLSNCTLVLSASKYSGDGLRYGLEVDSLNKVNYWEDARRVNTGIKILEANESSPPTVENSITLLNNQDAVKFDAYSEITSDTPISGKTFVWMYMQTEYGFRYMTNTFPDIKGTGELWTILNNLQVHGATPVTKLTAKVHRIQVNTLNYKLKLNTPVIITATQPDNQAINFDGFLAMRGYLCFFASWDTILTSTELDTVVALLAQRYYSSLAPYIFDTSTEYRFASPMTVDLTKKVSDLQAQDLTYNLLTSHYDSSIDVNGILTVSNDKDEVLHYEIEVTNEIPLTSTLEFDLDIVLKTNPLYLSLKALGLTFVSFYLADVDSIITSGSVITTWNDYRNNGKYLYGSTVNLTTLPQLENYWTADFTLDGSSYFTFSTPVSGKCFIVVYIRKPSSTGKAFLLGNDVNATFSSGVEGRLFDNGLTSSTILNSTNYVNGRVANYSYLLAPEVVNTVVINSTDVISADTVAKDRVFTDRSVKGYIPLLMVLEEPITDLTKIKAIDKAIRDYYDPAKFITLLHLDNNILDSSVKSKTISYKGSFNSSNKKFGTHSFELVKSGVCNYIYIPNDIDYAFLNEDFTISFWLNGNQRLNDEILTLYEQSDLSLFIYDNVLHVGIGSIVGLSVLSYSLVSGFYNSSNIFHHIQVCRGNGKLYLFMDGVLVGSTDWYIEYVDYISPIKIGQTINLTKSSGTNYFIDEIAVYKRTAFNIDTFTVPSTSYTP